MSEFQGTESTQYVITEQMERESRDYCKWSMGDEFNEEAFVQAGIEMAAEYTAELQATAKFYDDEIARLNDKLMGLEPEEAQPVAN